MRLALDVRFSGRRKNHRPHPQRTFTGGAFVDRSHHSARRSASPTWRSTSRASPTPSPTRCSASSPPRRHRTQTHRLTPFRPLPRHSPEESPSSSAVAKTYTVLGIQHILEGIDHLLFVLCLIIVAGINRKLLITITGFTLAHSITLALAALGVLNIPVPPVEAVIALSIVFLATEIAKTCRDEASGEGGGNRDSLTYRYPVTVSMSFGLLHGFGFAAVLSEIGLPRTEIPTALLFFNVGVELGQLAFIAAVILAFALLRLVANRVSLVPGSFPHLAPKFAAYAIGTIAAYWTIERIASF